MVSTSISDRIFNVMNFPSPGKPSSVLVASLALPKFKLLSFSSTNDPRSMISPRGGLLRLNSYKSGGELTVQSIISVDHHGSFRQPFTLKSMQHVERSMKGVATSSFATISWLASSQVAYSATDIKANPVYQVGEGFELGIQLSYLLLLLGFLGAGSFFVIRQVLLRRELDLSAKELQEQVRSGDASAIELFELGAVMLRRKFYPAATKFLLQAIDRWDGDDQDLAQVYNALGVSYVRDGKLEKGITQFRNAVKLQPGYVTARINLGDAYEKKKDMTSALKAFEEVLLFDPNNRLARPRVDYLRDQVKMYKGVPVKSKQKS